MTFSLSLSSCSCQDGGHRCWWGCSNMTSPSSWLFGKMWPVRLAKCRRLFSKYDLSPEGEIDESICALMVLNSFNLLSFLIKIDCASSRPFFHFCGVCFFVDKRDFACEQWRLCFKIMTTTCLTLECFDVSHCAVILFIILRCLHLFDSQPGFVLQVISHERRGTYLKLFR